MNNIFASNFLFHCKLNQMKMKRDKIINKQFFTCNKVYRQALKSANDCLFLKARTDVCDPSKMDKHVKQLVR